MGNNKQNASFLKNKQDNKESRTQVKDTGSEKNVNMYLKYLCVRNSALFNIYLNFVFFINKLLTCTLEATRKPLKAHSNTESNVTCSGIYKRVYAKF